MLLYNQKSCLTRGWHDCLIVSNAVIMQLVMHYATGCSEVQERGDYAILPVFNSVCKKAYTYLGL